MEKLERILTERRVGLARTFDARPCSDASITDLALAQFEAYRLTAVDPETIAANHRPIDLQLGSLRLYDPERIFLIWREKSRRVPGLSCDCEGSAAIRHRRWVSGRLPTLREEKIRK